MRGLVLLVVCSLGCGREIVDERVESQPLPVEAPTEQVPPVAPTPMGETPGWYDAPEDPLVRLGLMMPEVLDGVLLHGTVSFEPAAPDGLYRLVMVWKNDPTERTVAVVRRDATSIRGRLQPPDFVLEPSTCGRGRRATGVLFVVHESTTGDESVMGTSAPHLAMNGGTSFEVTFDECASGQRTLPPLMLQLEPRLAFARCAATAGRCFENDPVRVRSATLEVDGDAVRLAPTFVFGPGTERLTLEVNGAVQTVGRSGAVPRSAFIAGRNRVTWRIGARQPWEAFVVLPDTALAPSADAPLRLNDAFTLRWAETRWATRFQVDLSPVDVPWTRAVYPSFTTTQSPLTARFEGFPSGTGQVVTGTRAGVTVTATRQDGSFAMLQREFTEAPITR
jgi:hypothetical protein